ncbi:MAG: hypothetical protein ABEL76_11220 [Bradymonadaceae bacterium]
MSLVRYGTNVFDLDEVDGLNLYEAGDSHRLEIFLHGDDSFELFFDTAAAAEQAFDTLCQELDVRDLTPGGGAEESESVAAL